jgi:hypothetical protein
MAREDGSHKFPLFEIGKITPEPLAWVMPTSTSESSPYLLLCAPSISGKQINRRIWNEEFFL